MRPLFPSRSSSTDLLVRRASTRAAIVTVLLLLAVPVAILHPGGSAPLSPRGGPLVPVAPAAVPTASRAAAPASPTSGLTAGGSPAAHPAVSGAPYPGNWTQMSPTSTPPTTQSGGMVYDPTLGEFVLFGGNSGGGALGDTWVYSDGTWTDLTSTLTTAPAARWYFGFTWDAADHYALLFGGRDGSTDMNDTWAFNATGWHDIATSQAPPLMTTSRLVYDASDGYVWLYGGYSIMAAAPSSYNSTWTYRAGNWTNITANVTGAPPDPHAVTDAVYDSTDGYILMYGGSRVGNATCGTAGYTWTYLNGTYTNLTSRIGLAPPVSSGSRMIADDPALGGVMLYGGWDGGVCPFGNETWAYRNGTWYNQDLNYNPGPLWDAPTAGDGPAGSVLMFSGNTVPGTGTQSSETWNFTPAVAAAISSRGLAGIVPFTVEFNSTVGGPGPFSYNWSWGDGSAKNTTANASHTYTATGTFTVKFEVQDVYGKTTNATAGVGVYATLAASASASTNHGDAPASVQFVSSSVGGVPPVTVAWAFGDGDSSTSADPTHVYAAGGNYTWWLNASDVQGHTSSVHGSVLVAPPLVATPVVLNATRGTAPLSVDLSTVASGGKGPYTFLWSFGDGATAGGTNATTHTYTTIGTFAGNVSVTDANLVRIVQKFTVEVVAPLAVNALATPSVGVAPLPVAFQAIGSGGFPPYTFTWSFGTAAPSQTGTTAQYSYLTSGKYLPELRINDSDGHQIVTQLSITVVPPLALALAPNPRMAIIGSPFDFEVNTTGGLGPFTYAWGFGDGTAVTGSGNESHTYRASGTFRITVSVTDQLSEVRSASVVVQVIAPLVASVAVNLTNLTVGESYSLYAVVAGGLAPTTLNWSGLPPGCPTTSHASVLDCVAQRAGTYPVSIWVNDSAGQARHANTTVVIQPPGSTSGTTLLGVPWIDLVLLVALAVLLVVVVVQFWRRRAPPTEASPPDEAPSDAPGPWAEPPPPRG
ncbi:MAG TPA: PKD domain-containing protein [Thermoplasmata archaeon]|nr:PKD domain-containing protein [Thermoplasmata archaeon]